MIATFEDKLTEQKNKMNESLEEKVKTMIEKSTPPLQIILETINQTLVQTISDTVAPFRSRQDRLEKESENNFEVLKNQLSSLVAIIRQSETKSMKCDQNLYF